MVTVDFNETNLISPEEIECMLIFHQESLEQAPHPPPPGYCPRVWDYVLCWPPTPGATLAHIPCFPELNGIKYDTTKNATRLCHSNGTWDDYTDFSACAAFPAMESSLPKLLSPVEITTILYITGYTLSLVALSAAVFIFIYFKDLRCLRNTIHTNLMATYILSDTVWMLTHPIQMYQSNEGTLGQECTIAILTLNIILHYLYLTNFFWMFVEGLYLYMLVVKTFARQNLKLRGYATIGWGAPLIVMVIWIAVKSFITNNVHSESRLEARLISAMMPQCSLLMPDLYDWIYQGPMLFVLLLNIVFLSSIMWVLITKLRAATNAETQQYRKATKALLVLIPLLGVTYILFIDAPTEDHIASVYHNVRAVLLSTQGFLVALLYCFLNSEVQNTFRHHLAQWKEARDIGMGPRYSTSKEWSPSTQQESMRLFPTKFFQRKRQMSVSEATTMTLLGHSVRQGSNVEAGDTRSENVL
ncbi:diuretic hormone receptor-like isoform X2 [Homalodisca vitripennis]|uniref:diuretic hormone receptor-like isoform X1 n=2 Tax=Homalodisca vitripennis TaxID=197043 RepID=UPI001EEA8EEF|nr:diuretic hormone receptor-like isoform X1 [Homalodisca vitripennis]XP_046678645.1 diuretic hormone receptor-like isoform X2 [Homalodisca vitripennis]